MDLHRRMRESFILALFTTGILTLTPHANAADFDLHGIPVADWVALSEEGLLSVQEIRDQFEVEPVTDPGFDGTPALLALDLFWTVQQSIPAGQDLVLRGSHYEITKETGIGLVVDPNEFYADEPDPSFALVILDGPSGNAELFVDSFDTPIESAAVGIASGENVSMKVTFTHTTGSQYKVSVSWFGSESGMGAHEFTSTVTLDDSAHAMYGGSGLISVGPEDDGAESFDLQGISVEEWIALTELGPFSVQEIRDQFGEEFVTDPGFDGTPALQGSDLVWISPQSIPAGQDLVLRGSHYEITKETGIGLIVDPDELYADEPDPELVYVVLDGPAGTAKLIERDFDAPIESASVGIMDGENLFMKVKFTHVNGDRYAVSVSWFGSESGPGSHDFDTIVTLEDPAYTLYGGSSLLGVGPEDDGTESFDLRDISQAAWIALSEQGPLSVQEIRDQFGEEPVTDPGFDGTPALLAVDLYWTARRSIPTGENLVLRGSHYDITRETGIGLVVDPNEFYADEPDPMFALVNLDGPSGKAELFLGDFDTPAASADVGIVDGENLHMNVTFEEIGGGQYTVSASWFGSESGEGSHDFSGTTVTILDSGPGYVMYGGSGLISVPEPGRFLSGIATVAVVVVISRKRKQR